MKKVKRLTEGILRNFKQGQEYSTHKGKKEKRKGKGLTEEDKEYFNTNGIFFKKYMRNQEKRRINTETTQQHIYIYLYYYFYYFFIFYKDIITVFEWTIHIFSICFPQITLL